MYNQTKHTTNKSVPTPPTCYLHWIGCVTTYGLILTKSARFAFKPTHPPVGFSPMGARSVYLQSMMRSKTNKDENIQNYLKETLLLVFVLFLLVSLNNICRGNVSQLNCSKPRHLKRMEHQTQWQPLLQQNVATHRTQRLYATRTHKFLAALPLETYTPN